MVQLIIVPGMGGSDEAHWQTHWEGSEPDAIRLKPESWTRPSLINWLEALDTCVAEAAAPPILVAHSLGYLLVAHWSKARPSDVMGAILVAVPDPNSSVYPEEAREFAAAPDDRLRFPSVIMASSDDPFASESYARSRAEQWGSELILVGAHGHLGDGSGLRDWPEGRRHIRRFINRAA